MAQVLQLCQTEPDGAIHHPDAVRLLRMGKRGQFQDVFGLNGQSLHLVLQKHQHQRAVPLIKVVGRGGTYGDIQEVDVALVKVCKAQSAHREALTIHLAHLVGEVGHTGDLITILIEQLRLHGERQAEQQEHSYRFLHHSHFTFLGPYTTGTAAKIVIDGRLPKHIPIF